MKNRLQVSHSEMLAKKILDQYLGSFRKVDNAKPEWLGGLEIDRFYPSLGVAIEFQGDQHYRTVPGMHKNTADFKKQLDNDTKKRDLIENRGLKIHTINFLDLDRYKVQSLVKTIVEEGKEFTKKTGDRGEYSKLQLVRTDIEPDQQLMKSADRLVKVRKSYYKQKPTKTPWWVKLIRKI